jgi:hypothetical protein
MKMTCTSVHRTARTYTVRFSEVIVRPHRCASEFTLIVGTSTNPAYVPGEEYEIELRALPSVENLLAQKEG